MFVTIFDQSILWINSMSVSKKFRTRVDAAFESADQSRFSMKPTITGSTPPPLDPLLPDDALEVVSSAVNLLRSSRGER